MVQVTLERRNANIFNTQKLNVADDDRFRFPKEKPEVMTAKL